MAGNDTRGVLWDLPDLYWHGGHGLAAAHGSEAESQRCTRVLARPSADCRSDRDPGARVRRLPSAIGAERVELDSVDERVVFDRPCVRGSVTKRFAVRFAGSKNVLFSDS
jgi:hypothetical protein